MKERSLSTDCSKMEESVFGIEIRGCVEQNREFNGLSRICTRLPWNLHAPHNQKADPPTRIRPQNIDDLHYSYFFAGILLNFFTPPFSPKMGASQQYKRKALNTMSSQRHRTSHS